MEDFTIEEVRERFQTFPEELKDGLDLFILFKHHNLWPDDDTVNVYKDRIEIYNLNCYDEDTECESLLPYFEDNFIIFHIPNEECFLVEFVDYDEDIDIEERKEVKKLLQELLPEMVTHPNIIFQHNG